MSKSRIMIIDGNSLIHRAFYAMPPLKNKEGLMTNAVYGFLNMYYKLVDDYKPEYMAVVFDKKGATFRHKEYEDYKAGRAKTPDELSIQFPMLKEVLERMNISILELDGFEADDIAGTIATLSEKGGFEAILVSGDKDYLQLVDDNTRVVITKKGISDTTEYDRQRITEEYQLSPNQLIDLKGLMGDKSDNIPGVPGVGSKTGIKLLKEHGSVEELYNNLEMMKQSALKNKLELYRSQAFMSKMLARIVRDVPLDIDLEELKIGEIQKEELAELYERFEFKSLLDKIGAEQKDVREESNRALDINYNIIDRLDGLLGVLDEVGKEVYIKFSYDYEEQDKLVGVSLIIGNDNYYVDFLRGDISEGDFFELFKVIAESEDISKYGYDIKQEVVAFLRNGIDIVGFEYDGMVAMYLIDPSTGNYLVKDISRKYLNLDIPDIKELLGKGKNKKALSELETDQLADFGVRELYVIKESKDQIELEIKGMDMEELFYDVEIPLSQVLGDMEYRGFKVDLEELERLKLEMTEKLDKIEREVYDTAGCEFNINSPKQLSEVLFEKLGLTPIKKTKTGYSTNAEVLEKLKGEHDVVESILEYRQIAKLKSTYIDGLESVVDTRDGRAHSSFNQTITTTGRISSTEPNLQNIPIRTEEGRKIRKLFTSSSSEYKLVDADYSQIELRVLAHISDDEKLKEAFYKDIDVHQKTASEVFGVPLESVDSTMRGRAKAVNFGIVYGISDFGLSRDLNISKKEAQEYIDSYFKNYPNVKHYLDRVISDGKNKGYVETILRRRRYIPELSSRNFNIRKFGERIAMNTPIQGSAADIIKVAMVNIYRELKKRNLRSRLILQVHDELIIEAHIEEVEEIKALLRELMESAVVLSVPLSVDMEVGDNWYESK